ncbi:MAG: hypothetical protein IPO16_07385 [Saprospiraceae bacterium]|nr:hypothetical protein [Saprospiraceae bacterium]
MSNNEIKINKRLELMSEVYSRPIIDSTNLIVGLCYAGGNIPLINVDLKTGKKNWHATSQSKMGNIRANLVEYKNHIWIGGTYSNKFFGIDKNTGKSTFEIEAGAECFPAWSAPAFKDNIAFLPRNDGYLHIIDINSKEAVDKIDLKVDKKIPKYEYGNEVIDEMYKYVRHKWENYFYSTPIVKEKSLFIGTEEGYFYSINIQNK